MVSERSSHGCSTESTTGATLLHEGVKELLFCKLELLHQQMVDNGGVCTVEAKQTAERIYLAYHGLGGNGVGTEMRNDILDAHIQEDRN